MTPSTASTDRPVLFFTTRCSKANGAMLDAIRLAEDFRARTIPAECWALYSSDGTISPGIGKCFLPYPPKHIGDWVRMLATATATLWRANPQAVYGFNPLANVLGCGVALLRGCKNRIGTQRNPHYSQTPLLGWLDKICGSLGIYTRNIFISPDVARSYASYPRAYLKRSTMVWNGVPLRLSTLDQAAARAKFNLPADVNLIGTVGRLAPQKNQRFLIELMRLLPAAHLALAGSGELEDELKALTAAYGLNERIHFLGTVNGEDVPDFLRTLDIFAFPSAYEGFGIALLEAMQNSLPCMTSDLANFKDILQDNAGITLPTDLPRRWAEAVSDLLADKTRREKFGEQAQNRAKDFSFEAMSEGYLALIPHK